MTVSGDLRRRRRMDGVVDDAEDLNRPAKEGAKDVPAWNWVLSLSHDGKDSLTMAKKWRRRGKVREGERRVERNKGEKKKRAVVEKAR